MSSYFLAIYLHLLIVIFLCLLQTSYFLLRLVLRYDHFSRKAQQIRRCDRDLIVVDISASSLHCFAIAEFNGYFFAVRNAKLLFIVGVDETNATLCVFQMAV